MQPIQNSTQGAQATASILQSRDLVLSSTTMFKNLGEVGLGIISADPALANTADVPCAEGGTYKYTGTVSGGTYDLTVTFDGCRDARYQYQGDYKLTGTAAGGITIALGGGSDFNVFYFNSDYTLLIAYLKTQLSYTLSGSGSATASSYTIVLSGNISTFDYSLLNTYTMTFSNGYTVNYALSTNWTTQKQAVMITVNGTFLESWTNASLSAGLSGFQVYMEKNYDAATASYVSDDTSLSGSVTFNYRPNNYCFEGAYDVSTTTPVHNDYRLGYATQGQLIVNGTVTVQYNAGGDVSVTFTGDQPISFMREYQLMKMCDFSALEGTLPPLLGTTGTATGSTMTVTLTWFSSGGSSTSDMDLHVKYYAQTAPLATAAETWHMDWHQSSDGCTGPTGISFSDSLDLDGNGTCDVGLDFDDTNGYGPEHITALQIPAGYYVISVNSYGLGDPDAILYLAIHIGDYIFGPFTATLTASDGEGTDPASWYRVADVRVNGDGTADVLVPNTVIPPWH